MRTPRMDERGIALVIAVFALVVIGALVAGTFFIGRLEQQTGRTALYVTQAAEAADAGIAATLAEDQSVFNAIAIWTPLAPANEITLSGVTSIGGNATIGYTRSVRRLNNELFLVRSTGQRYGPGGTVLAAQQAGLLMRITKPTFSVNSAITVTQPVQLNGNAFVVNGINANPAGWLDCDPARLDNLDDKVGIRSSSSTGLNSQDLDNVFGYPAPAVANDPTITSATFQDFLDATFTTMASQQGVKAFPLTTPYNGVGPVAAGGVCDKSQLLNLGEPARLGYAPLGVTVVPECYNYMPIVHGTGSRLSFAAGTRGQGTLLVDGDLEISGGFQWSGLILVRGSFKVTGTGNKITGAVLAESVTDNNMLGGDVTVQYSACAVAKAVQGAATPAPLNQRSWMQLYQ